MVQVEGWTGSTFIENVLKLLHTLNLDLSQRIVRCYMALPKYESLS